LKPPEAGPEQVAPRRLAGRSGRNKRLQRRLVNPRGSPPHELLTRVGPGTARKFKPQPLELAPNAFYVSVVRVVGCADSAACGAPKTAKDAKPSGGAGRLKFRIVGRSTKNCMNGPMSGRISGLIMDS